MDLKEMAAMLKIAQNCSEKELLILAPLFRHNLKWELREIPQDQRELCVPEPLRRFLPEQPT